jgi:hypothetical protein
MTAHWCFLEGHGSSLKPLDCCQVASIKGTTSIAFTQVILKLYSSYTQVIRMGYTVVMHGLCMGYTLVIYGLYSGYIWVILWLCILGQCFYY